MPQLKNTYLNFCEDTNALSKNLNSFSNCCIIGFKYIVKFKIVLIKYYTYPEYILFWHITFSLKCKLCFVLSLWSEVIYDEEYKL